MEPISSINRKYKNYRNEMYNYTSNQEEDENDYEFINKRTYDSQKKNQNNLLEDKEIINGSRSPININNNMSNFNRNYKRQILYNTLNSQYFDNTKFNKNKLNNDDSIYKTQYTNYNRNINNNYQGNNNNNNSINRYPNNSLSKREPKIFSSLAKALKYFNNKVAYNNNIYFDSNSGKKINKIVVKNDLSTDKSNDNFENKSFNNTNNFRNKNNNRNYNIQKNYNKKKIKTLNGEGISKNNKIWANINKELLPQEEDLNNRYFKDKNKSLTPYKINKRYFKNNLKSNTIENLFGNKKIFKENQMNQYFRAEDLTNNILFTDVNENDKIKNIDYLKKKIIEKEINKKDYLDKNNGKKNKNKNNYSKNLENNNKKNILDSNKNIINKEQNDKKPFPLNKFLCKNKFTKSSPNILNQFKQLNIKNLKSSNELKDQSLFSSAFSKIGKIPKRNFKSSENSFDKCHTIKNLNNLNNIQVNLLNTTSPNNKRRKGPKANMNLDETRNQRLKKLEDERLKQKHNEINDINNKQFRNQTQTYNLNNTLEDKKKLKHIMSHNNIKTTSNKKENNINNYNNAFYFKQTNNTLVFQKKVNRSPPAFSKTNIINNNNNIELSENSKSILKLTQEINSSNLKTSTNENNFKIEKNIYNYNYIGNNNINTCSNESEKNQVKKSKIINSIESLKNSKNINITGRKIYIRQKAKKKVLQPKNYTQGKLDIKRVNQRKIEEKNNENSIKRIFENERNSTNYKRSLRIKNKINFKKQNLITKYYDYFTNYPEIKNCFYSKIYLKEIKIPKIEVCHISKVNSAIYVLYKSKSVCYYTKIRQITTKLIQPPVNKICEFSKSIILNPPSEKINKIENQNNSKKSKKTKKRRKTRRIHKENDNENRNENDNDNDNEDNSIENNDNEDDEDIILEKENEDDSNEEKSENYNNQSFSNNFTPNNNIEENNLISSSKKINDKLLLYITPNKVKSGSNEGEIDIADIDKKCSTKKKLGATINNDEDFNNEENEDFKIALDEEEEISNDNNERKDSEQESKTEGKEIIYGYENNININDKNKMTNIEKTTKVFKLLEKLQGKRNSYNEYEKIKNLYYNNYIENSNEKENKHNFNDNINNYEGINKNIFLGTNKLNEIFNHQNLKHNNENLFNTGVKEETTDYNNINYSKDNIEINNNNSENENDINYILYKKKINTYKKKVDYQKIGSIFDRLEGIFDKKKSSGRYEFNDSNNKDNLDSERCKTPELKKGASQVKNGITDFNLKKEEYLYNNYNKNNNYNENDNDNDISNENINDEINNENMETEIEEKKNNYIKKDVDMDKYKEIFNKQQIISKLELLMNKLKNKTNQEYSIHNNAFNNSKYENEKDYDMNNDKDISGDRIINNNLLQSQNMNNKIIYTFEEIFSYKNKKICQNTNLLSLEVINHCNEISNNIEHKDSFKPKYKNINMNSNNYVYTSNNTDNLTKNGKESSMGQWARKDMTKEIEEAEKYVKELNSKMSKDNFKYEIIEILNTLTVDNYKNILNKMKEMLYFSENDKNHKIKLNKPEYLLHNQFIFAEIILDKATIEKGYVVLYAKLCADLFIELIKLIKEYYNVEMQNQLINGENLKTILTSECRQRFDECISVSTLNKSKDDYEKKEIFLILKKKFLGNMNFIAELINVKLLSQTKGFEFLDLLYKRYKEIKNNDKIKFLNLEGAVTLLTKFGRIIMERKNPKHIQNLENYMKDNINPIVSNNNNIDNKGLPNYLKFKIINLIEKKKNNWKDSLYEQSIIAKGKNSNISLSNELADSNIIDESLIDSQKIMNNNNQEKEESIIILLKNDIDNYVTFLNEHNIHNKDDLNEYNNKNENNIINNEYDWSISEELINKARNELEEIIRCYIEVCIDYVTKEKYIFFCGEYIKNIVNYYSIDLTKDEIERVHDSMIEIYLNIEDICIDNFLMFEIMGYLLLILFNNNLLYIEDLDKFINEDRNKIIKISQVIKFTIIYSEEKYKELYNNLKKIKLFNDNKSIFEEYVIKPLKDCFKMNLD